MPDVRLNGESFGNQEIDHSKSCLNYTLAVHQEMAQLDFLNLEEVEIPFSYLVFFISPTFARPKTTGILIENRVILPSNLFVVRYLVFLFSIRKRNQQAGKTARSFQFVLWEPQSLSVSPQVFHEKD